jgi:mRNA deadenylase 3'-5' endonuclease subunit Ccr4
MTSNTKNIILDKTQNQTLRVITFNLLSSDYATPEFFPYVEKHYLDFAPRVEKVKKLLKSWMKVNFIICLQEVNTLWENTLEDFFSENNYILHSETYANNKLGVGIAYPFNHYTLLDIDNFVCGSYIKTKYDAMGQLQREDIDNYENIMVELSNASESKNVLISALFGVKKYGQLINKNVIVSVYHMPCKFQYNFFMASHIHAIKSQLNTLYFKWNPIASKVMGRVYEKHESIQSSDRIMSSACYREQTNSQNHSIIDKKLNCSIILVGDFNIMPSNVMYKFLTGESYSDDELQNDAKCIKELYQVYSHIGCDLFVEGINLRSAHKLFHGTEPSYTNVCLQHKKTFVDCIDYILISDNTNVLSCTLGLTVSNPTTTPYPNGLCPSDHIPVSASLFIF